MVTACIVLLYVSYAIPVIALLVRGRNTIRHGPFWLGPIGLFSNCVLLAWTVFTIIMYSFPYLYPATANSEFSRETLLLLPLLFPAPYTLFLSLHPSKTIELFPPSPSLYLPLSLQPDPLILILSSADMNYVSAVYAVVVFIIAVDWLARGRKHYRGQTDRKEAIEETVRHASIVSFPDRGVGQVL
jgi:choline transport protein